MLPVYAARDKSGNKNILIYRAILDPYLIDIYQTKVVFKDANGVIVDTVVSGGEDIEYNKMHFITKKINSNSINFDFYTINSMGTSFKLFSGKLIEVEYSNNKFYKKINWENLKISADYDGELRNDTININDHLSSADEASIWFDLNNFPPSFFSKDVSRYFGVEVSSTAQKHIQLILYDKDSRSAYRNYTKLMPGKNLILLHWAGFYEIDNLSDPSTLRLRIFSQAGNPNPHSQVQIENFIEFQNQIGIFNYMDKTNYRVNLKQLP